MKPDPTEIEIAQTIGECAAEFDDVALAYTVRSIFEEIADAITCGPEAVGIIIIKARKQVIANMASVALFDKLGVIKPEEVKV